MHVLVKKPRGCSVRGFTSTELLFSSFIVGLSFLMITSNILTENKCHFSILDAISTQNEANVAMDHMSKVLRFAIYPIAISKADRNGVVTISATIEGGKISFIGQEGTDAPVIYTYNSDTGNKNDHTNDYILTFTQGNGGIPVTLAQNITEFSCGWKTGKDRNNRLLTISVKSRSEENQHELELKTKIKILGEES